MQTHVDLGLFAVRVTGSMHADFVKAACMNKGKILGLPNTSDIILPFKLVIDSMRG